MTDTHSLDIPASMKKFLLSYGIDVKMRFDVLEQ